jgi:hypothetical protein
MFSTPNVSWAGGDPQTPSAGGLYSYLVVGELADGRQTNPGTGSNGSPRSLAATVCPP